MHPVYIAWVDAQADADHWTPAANLEHTAHIIRTVGYDIGPQIDGHTSLASSWDSESNSYGHVMHVPDACIMERHALNIAVPIEGLD